MILALIPAYNEERTVQDVIRDIQPHVDEVVVIDDASHDATAELARAAGATVLVHKINRGQGAALETGHCYARKNKANMVVHFDADGQFIGSEVAKAIKALRAAEAEVLLGSRFLDTASDIPFSKKHILLPLGRLFDRLVNGVKLSDFHNGFRVLGQRALEDIVITQDRMAHASEIPMLIKQHNLRYIEFPVTVRYNEYGQGVVGGLRVLKDIIFGKFIR